MTEFEEDVAVREGTMSDNAESHIAYRRSFGGLSVYLYSDGGITGIMGAALPGVPIARPKTDAAKERELRAGWLFMGAVEITADADLSELHKACRWVAARSGLPGDVRARLAASRRPVLPWQWTVISADRDGKPTARAGRLPRLRWPDLMVWDHCRSSRRYEVVVRVSSRIDTYRSTGCFFDTQDALLTHLQECT